MTAPMSLSPKCSSRNCCISCRERSAISTEVPPRMNRYTCPSGWLLDPDIRLGIERQPFAALHRDVHRRKGRDRLRLPVLQHFEVVHGQPRHRLVVLVRDVDVHLHGFDAAAENRGLRLLADRIAVATTTDAVASASRPGFRESPVRTDPSSWSSPRQLRL